MKIYSCKHHLSPNKSFRQFCKPDILTILHSITKEERGCWCRPLNATAHFTHMCLVQIHTLVVLATWEHVCMTEGTCARLSQVLKTPKRSALKHTLSQIQFQSAIRVYPIMYHGNEKLETHLWSSSSLERLGQIQEIRHISSQSG